MPKGVANNPSEKMGNSVFLVVAEDGASTASIQRIPLEVENDGETYFAKGDHAVKEIASLVTAGVDPRFRNRITKDVAQKIRVKVRRAPAGEPVELSLKLEDYMGVPSDEDEVEDEVQAAE